MLFIVFLLFDLCCRFLHIYLYGWSASALIITTIVFVFAASNIYDTSLCCSSCREKEGCGTKYVSAQAEARYADLTVIELSELPDPYCCSLHEISFLTLL
jgi:hypothetical protein